MASTKDPPPPLDLTGLKVYPLVERQSLSRIEQLLVDPAQPPPACSPEALENIARCAESIRFARSRGASVMLMYGAHLIKNGAQRLVNSLVQSDWLTHLATNGAGSIHDWELAFLGRT